MPDIKIITVKIFEDDYTDWFEGKSSRYVSFEPDIFVLIHRNFGKEIKRIEIFEKDKFVIRIYRVSRYGIDLGKLSESQILRLAGLFADEVRLINYYTKYYSPQSSRLFGLKNYSDEYVETVKAGKPRCYEIQDNVLMVYL